MTHKRSQITPQKEKSLKKSKKRKQGDDWMLLTIIMIGYSSEKELPLIIFFSNLTYWFFYRLTRYSFHTYKGSFRAC